MAGGTWTLQNKARPGAYINFKAVPDPGDVTSTRGVAAMPLVLNWGPEAQIIEVYSTDLTDGAISKKLGYNANATEILQVRECLKGCYKLLAYRVNTGGTAASAELGSLTVTAKYPGIRGNDIQVGVLEKGVSYDIITYLDNAEVDRQQVTAISELVNNDFVEFRGTGDLSTQAVTKLTGGINGSSPIANYESFFELLKTQSWQVMGLPIDDNAITTAAVAAIRGMREELGKKVQAVVYNTTADYEGIISVKQGYRTDGETISAVDFVAYATGISAGAEIPQPNTYREIEGASTIINPMSDAEITAALEQGFMVISRRTDGVIVIEQDINTLVTFTADRPKAFCKNRLIRTLDEIANTTCRLFENSFLGKVNNDITGRELFKQALGKELKSLQDLGAIEGFNTDDIAVSAGAADDSVVVTMAVNPVDAMEKLYITVEVN